MQSLPSNSDLSSTPANLGFIAQNISATEKYLRVARKLETFPIEEQSRRSEVKVCY